MSWLADRVAPARMGSSFRWLLASSTVSNVGDGLALAAGPLLVASQTANAILVAMAGLCQRLPWLLLGLYAGAVADRVDRRVLVMAADGVRAVVVGVLTVAIVSGRVSIAVVLVVMLALGVAEVFADTTGQTLLPMLVGPADLGVGNARFQASSLVANQIVGPAAGAFLFAAGRAWPFAAQTVLVALGVVLIARVATPKGAVRDVRGTRVRTDIVEGVRWLMGNDAVRTLALVIVVFNVTWGAAWSVMVLYALHHLHLTELGYAFLITAAAAGGLAGTVSFGWIQRRFDFATVMRVCLLLEVLTHLALAVTTVGWVAMVVMVIFGAYAFVWTTVSQTVRQRATPTAFQGRVGSAYLVAVFAGLVVGQGLDGWIAQTWGLTAPFWFAFVGSGVTLALVWRQLGFVAHAQAAGD